MLTFLGRKTLGTVLGGMLLCVCVVACFVHWSKDKALVLVTEAERAIADQKYTTLATLVQKHPKELASFQGITAQKMICAGIAEEVLFSQVLGDLQQKSPLHARIAAITFLINKGNARGALDESIKLEEEFKNEKNTGVLIQPGMVTRAYNLLRIAELQHSLGLKFEEVDTWQQFEEMAGWNGAKASGAVSAYQEAFYLLEKGFIEEGIDLRQYVQHRKQLASQ
ncbi:MAG: hypothetical protein KGZ39_06880 [Simkania sp.]|nr:hypothetical protein [Simkania sp.]